MDMLIDTRLVENEILIYGECTLNGAICHDLSLNSLDIFTNRIGLRTIVLILGIIHRIVRLALMRAAWSVTLRARRTCAVNMMLTW